MNETERAGQQIVLGHQVLRLSAKVARALRDDPICISDLCATRVWLRRRADRIVLYVGDVQCDGLDD